MTLTNAQIERLKDLADYDWFDESDDEVVITDKLKTLIDQVESDQEFLFTMFVKEWEPNDLWILLDHPMCDYGFAFRIYWMLQPDFYYRKREKNEEMTESEQESWTVIQDIEERLLGGWYAECRNAFDPAEIVDRPLRDDDKLRRGIRLVPKELKVPSPGVELDTNVESIWS